MSRHIFPVSTWRVPVLLLLVLGSIPFTASISRSASPGISPPISVYACDEDVSIPSSGSTAPFPEACRGLENVRITNYSADGQVIDSCISERSGNCPMDQPHGGFGIFAQDPDTVPSGYHAEFNVIRTFLYTEYASVVFVNYGDGILPETHGDGVILRLHSRFCLSYYLGTDFFGDCHHRIPDRNQWIFANQFTAPTGKDGNATFRDLPAGETVIFGGQGYTTGDVLLYCSETNDLSIRREAATHVEVTYDYSRSFLGTLTLEPNDDVTCDWYVLPRIDRHMWSSVNYLIREDPEVTYPAQSGDIRIQLLRCPRGYGGASPIADCQAPETYATIRATSESGTEYAVARTDASGTVKISLSGQPVPSFWISLDGHASIERDQLTCESSSYDYLPIRQQVRLNTDSWTVDSMADDPQGIACIWYLVPTDS